MKTVNGLVSGVLYRNDAQDLVYYYVEDGCLCKETGGGGGGGGGDDRARRVPELWFHNGVPMEDRPPPAQARVVSKRLGELAARMRCLRDATAPSSLDDSGRGGGGAPPAPPSPRMSPSAWERPWRSKGGSRSRSRSRSAGAAAGTPAGAAAGWKASPRAIAAALVGGGAAGAVLRGASSPAAAAVRRWDEHGREGDDAPGRGRGSYATVYEARQRLRRRGAAAEEEGALSSSPPPPHVSFCPKCGQRIGVSMTPFCPQTGARHHSLGV